MGSATSRQRAREEEIENVPVNVYKYPCATGNYFGNYFILGGEKFDMPQPELYLFGDNMDLNYLASPPVPFPYPPPEVSDPTNPLKCLINIRRESLKLVRLVHQRKPSYNIEFIFDTDVRCSIVIHYFCTEDNSTGAISYIPSNPALSSEVYQYPKGVNQVFVQPDHVFNPTLYRDEELMYSNGKNILPVVIYCSSLDKPDDGVQSLATIAVFDHHSDGSYSIKTLKQKLFIDGLCLLLQEIYGIENKLQVHKDLIEDDEGDVGLECVICMCEMRDTLILPCRHLCLCQPCADSLRYQASNCPICRAPFRALLQIRAVKRQRNPFPQRPPELLSTVEVTPSGYDRISLMEALNGPIIKRKLSDSPNCNLHRKHGYRSSRRSGGTGKNVKHKPSCTCPRDVRSSGRSAVEPSVFVNSKSAVPSNDGEESTWPANTRSEDRPVVYGSDRTYAGDGISEIAEEVHEEGSEADKLSPLLQAIVTVSADAQLNTATHNDVTVDTSKVVCVDIEREPESTNDDKDDDDDVMMATANIVGKNTVVSSNSENQSKNEDELLFRDLPSIRICQPSCSTSLNSIPGSSNSNKDRKEKEESDYHTPDESTTSVLDSLQTDKERNSVPSTPASLASVKSSTDSYASNSSLRHLLSGHDKDTKQ